MEALAPWSLGLLAFCVFTDMARELNFKAASLRANPRRYVADLLLQPFLWAGVVFWAIEAVAWLVVLEHVRLAVAFAVMALTYAVTPLAACLLLRERLSRQQMSGAMLVALGVAVVSLSELKVGVA